MGYFFQNMFHLSTNVAFCLAKEYKRRQDISWRSLFQLRDCEVFKLASYWNPNPSNNWFKICYLNILDLHNNWACYVYQGRLILFFHQDTKHFCWSWFFSILQAKTQSSKQICRDMHISECWPADVISENQWKIPYIFSLGPIVIHISGNCFYEYQ